MKDLIKVEKRKRRIGKAPILWFYIFFKSILYRRISICCNIDTGKLIGLVKERKQIVIENFIKTWGEEVLEKIEEVSIDMTGNYKSLVDKVCSNAVVTVDRFHVTLIYTSRAESS